MRIQSVDCSSNFGNISKIKATYSKEQNQVANKIIKLFRERPKNASQTSLEKMYESKGYSFFVEPSYDNSVILKAYTPLGKKGKEIYSKKGSSFYVREYNQFDLPKNTQELDKEIQKSENRSLHNNLIMLAFLVVGAVLVPFIAKKAGTNKINPKELIKTEQICDTISNMKNIK